METSQPCKPYPVQHRPKLYVCSTCFEGWLERTGQPAVEIDDRHGFTEQNPAYRPTHYYTIYLERMLFMYSKRNKILSATLILVMVILSLAGCKPTEAPETKTDVSSVITQTGTIDIDELCLWDYNDLSDFLESERRSGKMFFNVEEGEYIKLFEDDTLSKEIVDYKTLLKNKMVVQKYDKSGNVIATYTLSGEEIPVDTSSMNTSSATENEKVTITVWGSSTDRTLKEVVDAYNKTSDSYEVKILTAPTGNILTRLNQAKARGQAPDMVYLDSGDMQTAAKSELLWDLSNFGAWEYQSDFVSNVYKTMANGISVYGIPLDAETTCLAYNLDIFNFAKIENAPKTYNELVDQAKKITENYSDKNAPVGLFDAEDKIAVADTFISWLYRCGGTLYSEDMKSVEFNGAMGERALTLIADLYKNNLASSTWKNGEFYSGKTAFFEVSSVRYNGTFGSGAKANFEAAENPALTSGENPSIFKVNGYSVVNNNDVNKAQGAYDFITYYCTTEAYQVNYCGRNSKIPTLTKAQENTAFNNDNMKVFISTLESAKCISSVSGTNIIKEYIADAVLSVINDNVSVTDALSKAAQKANNRLGRN